MRTIDDMEAELIDMKENSLVDMDCRSRKLSPEEAACVKQAIVEDAIAREPVEAGHSYAPGSGHVKIEVATVSGQDVKIRLVDDGGPVPAMIDELYEMVYSDKRRGTENAQAFLGPKYIDRTREIGEALNAIGGFGLMRAVHERIMIKFPTTGRTLEMAWDGIGSWCG